MQNTLQEILQRRRTDVEESLSALDCAEMSAKVATLREDVEATRDSLLRLRKDKLRAEKELENALNDKMCATKESDEMKTRVGRAEGDHLEVRRRMKFRLCDAISSISLLTISPLSFSACLY